MDSSWKVGSDRSYVRLLSRPLNYFLCLLRKESLIAKNVTHIRHGGQDAYYKCLLKLTSSELAVVFAGLAEEPRKNEWFQSHLRLHFGGVEILDYDEAPDDVGLPYAALPPLPALSASIIPPDIVSTLWRRCIVSDGIGEPLKVYFTDSSGGDEQRGFAHCDLHECRRYRPTSAHANRKEFCAEMFAWYRARFEEECSTKPDHLGFTASESDVIALLPQLTLSDF